MNAPHPLRYPLLASPTRNQTEDDDISLARYWDIVVDNKWLIAAITALGLGAGATYVSLAPPVFEANLVVQVEDTSGSAKSWLGDAASLLSTHTPASAELEIIRSRMVLGQAVESTKLYIDAKPKYFPLIGMRLARGAKTPSEPGILGIGGYVWGNESITVSTLDVPEALEGTPFTLTTQAGGKYTIKHPDLSETWTGTVGVPGTYPTPDGPVTLHVETISALPGAQFEAVRYSRLDTIEDLQDRLTLAERGRQSGIIEATLQGPDRTQLKRILNEVAKQYVFQNTERRAAEAAKTLTFLNEQLPQLRKQVEQAEGAYNQYRNKKGTVALDEEARLALTRSVELQGKLLDIQQKRKELVTRFTDEHPTVKTLDSQLKGVQAELAEVNDQIRAMPAVQQDALRLERDVKVSSELYQQLRNNAVQLQLVREGKVGSVRVIDEAVLPKHPVKPKRSVVLASALLAGLGLGIILALLRNALFRGIQSPQQIETGTGMDVLSTVPLSKAQSDLVRKMTRKEKGIHLLTECCPDDPAVESLRSLRSAMQFAMMDAPNNRVLISGASPAVGKSFISANFAAVAAAAGKRVLLIDADLRRGYLHEYFALPRENGLSELIAGSHPAETVLHREVLPHLDFISTGVLPPKPAELMMRRNFNTILEELSSSYDLILIDTPPVLVAADTLAIAPQQGTVLLVARAHVTQIEELRESAKRLAQIGKQVSGVLFNGLDLSRRQYGSYGYQYRQYKY